jgi:hypothetical protein
MSSTYQPMFPTTEGDLWRWQLETMTELAKFVKGHGPGKAGALPAVPWQISTGFHATGRLGAHAGPGDTVRDRKAVLAAYAKALDSEVTSIDLGHDRGTQYRVKGTIGTRVELLLIADISPEDEQGQDDTDAPRCARCGEPIEPASPGSWWHGGIVTDHEAVLADEQGGDGQ